MSVFSAWFPPEVSEPHPAWKTRRRRCTGKFVGRAAATGAGSDRAAPAMGRHFYSPTQRQGMPTATGPFHSSEPSLRLSSESSTHQCVETCVLSLFQQI